MKEIARNWFYSLNRDNQKANHYIVLNDGYFVADFYADNDKEAKEMFANKEY